MLYKKSLKPWWIWCWLTQDLYRFIQRHEVRRYRGA